MYPMKPFMNLEFLLQNLEIGFFEFSLSKKQKRVAKVIRVIVAYALKYMNLCLFFTIFIN